jgi:hypothetical protein
LGSAALLVSTPAASRPVIGRAIRYQGDDMTELNPQPLPPRAIRVTLPNEIFHDLDRFQKVQASVLAQAGCPTCTSGLQINWHNFEDWVVDLDGAVSPVLTNGALGARVE